MSKPVAYAAVAADGSDSIYVTTSREQAEAACRENGWFLVPLGTYPKELMLTADERRALEYARNACFVVANAMKALDGGKSEEAARAITGLLKRIVCDTKMDTTPDEGTVQNEGRVPSSRT